ncbi:ShlB/FhaC/HecB family hemolysin secretion/activation protein [Massilia aerilata]|uniref:ShlB/FhaC/HecB family hemolysin secretion/activation protein n=1 Tax=Massilia aerilata TaxID=453817 RepID=A0ABW0RYF3_9BURK
MTHHLARLVAGSVLAAAVGAAWADDEVRFPISRFEVSGNTLLAPAEVQAAVAPWTGQGRDFGDVQRALEALEALYHARGYKVVTVQLPEQELNGGVVRLNVIQTRLSRVAVSGNQYFSDANIRAGLPTLQPGRTPNLQEVSANLRLVNENPAKKVKLNLAGADADDEVEARVEVVDESPWKVMFSADNTGTEATGETHAGVMLQHANLWGRDHVGSLQYTTTAERPDRVAVWSAGYHIPLYALGDAVDLFASYSNVDSGTVNAGIFDLAVSGKGAVYGARYTHALAKRGDLESRLVYGVDYKAYKNKVVFGGQDFGNDVTVHPLSIGWAGNTVMADGEANLALTLLQNIAGGSRGGARDFNAVRANAKASYSMLRFSAAISNLIAGDWQTRVLLNGQATGDALVPGEQFGAGGSTTVRGFGERDLATDSGFVTNVELYTPNLCTRAFWQCRLLGFYDSAWGQRNHILPGELRRTAISSVGLGLRFAAGSRASVQLDYGHGIHTGQVQATSKNRLHVRVGLAY